MAVVESGPIKVRPVTQKLADIRVPVRKNPDKEIEDVLGFSYDDLMNTPKKVLASHFAICYGFMTSVDRLIKQDLPLADLKAKIALMGLVAATSMLAAEDELR